MLNNKGFKLPQNLLKSVPTGVLIDKDGNINALFSESSISYFVSTCNIKAAMTISESLGKNLSQPKSPYLLLVGTNTLSIGWDFPYCPGLSQQVEVYFVSSSLFSPHKLLCSVEGKECVLDAPVRGPRESLWQLLVTRSWCSENFNNYTLENLSPGTGFYFRVRVWSHEGWSQFSEMSPLLHTIATSPSVPSDPLIAVSMSTCMQLRWSKVSANGSDIKWYILRMRRDDDIFIEVYRGMQNSYLVMGLTPESHYSFDVAAENGIGLSGFSLPSTGTTPAVKSVDYNIDSPQTIAAMNCKEAWSECWDPNTEQYFYFNSLTGTRQLACPDVLSNQSSDVIGTNEKKELPSTVEDSKRTADINFRKKRFRLLKAIHHNLQVQLKRLNGTDTASPAPISKGHAEVFSVELRRLYLLSDGYKAISTAHLSAVSRKMKITFQGKDV